MANRPVGRRRHVTGTGNGVGRRGSAGLGGSVGNGGYSGRSGSGSGSSRGPRMGRGMPFLAVILILIISAVRMLSGSEESDTQTGSYSESTGTAGVSSASGSGSGSSYSTGSVLEQILGAQGYSSVTGTSQAWNRRAANTGTLNTDVAEGSRDKFTVINGDGSDQVTVMVYMCGADLESKSGMATNDLVEMINGKPGDHVNIVVYTGGARQWQNSAVSARKCQIWKVADGGLQNLISDDGDRVMTDPDTLTRFIQYCSSHYPANRNELIFWDHGGGSVSGYGYDEKHADAGSMSLSNIQRAVSGGGVKFDFIGFDACLMATAENALSLSDQADYLIASEETEPGTGWYYTNWIQELSDDPGISTLKLGQKIVDDFVDVSAQQSSGQKTTLSLIDLAELSYSLPDKLNAFGAAATEMIRNDQYDKVSRARSSTREFAQSSRIDQVDLVNLADNLETEEGQSLSEAVLSAVKYNRVSSSMTNAYGLSIYFPYQNLNYVDTMSDTYKDLDLDDEYADCIRSFAKMEASGQAASGTSSGAFPMLTGSYQSVGPDMVSSLLTSFLSGSSNTLGLAGTDFLSESSISDDRAVSYITEHQFDETQLVWNQGEDGSQILSMDESNWQMTQRLEKNLFVDDGEGYIDLGLDNEYEFDESGALIADTEGTWLAVNSQPVPYYHIDTVSDGDDYTIRGRIPVMLNGEYANLIVIFDTDHPDGYIAGAVRDYREEETTTIAKSMTSLTDGDVIDFVADYYTYDGTFDDAYLVGDQQIVNGDAFSLAISDVYVPEKLSLTYQFTDEYGQKHYTPVISIDR